MDVVQRVRKLAAARRAITGSSIRRHIDIAVGAQLYDTDESSEQVKVTNLEKGPEMIYQALKSLAEDGDGEVVRAVQDKAVELINEEIAALAADVNEVANVVGEAVNDVATRKRARLARDRDGQGGVTGQ